MDVDKRSISVALWDWDSVGCEKKFPFDGTAILTGLQRKFRGVDMAFTYETGPTGFGLYDTTASATHAASSSTQQPASSPCPDCGGQLMWAATEIPPKSERILIYSGLPEYRRVHRTRSTLRRNPLFGIQSVLRLTGL
jgi:hypothetical protein